MPDELLGHDPTPTPPHPLVAQSDKLDEEIGHNGVMQAMQRDQARHASVVRRLNVIVLVLMVVIGVMIYALFGIAHNASQLEGERRARHVFCLETNSNNAEARTVLINAFPDSDISVRTIAGLLFPTRDCTQDPPIVVDTVAVSNLPAPP